MASFEDVFGEGSVAYQMFIWQVVAQVIGSLLAPGFTELQTAVQSTVPVVPLSPADAATAANRAFMDLQAAADEAAKSGISGDRFAILQHLAGNAPAPEELATALRRGLIPATGSGPDAVSFSQGIAEGNLLDKWGPTIQALAKAIPSPADIVDAMIKGQVDAATGASLYETVGGDPQYFQLQVDIAGNPPSPGELLQLAKRGQIPWDGTGPSATTFQQGFYEGREKDKWEPVYRLLAAYYPTAGEIIELYRWNEMSAADAATALAARGMTAAEATAWLGYADQNMVNDYRGLTEQSILAMLSVGYIDDAQATTMLQAVHKGPQAIAELIEYGHIQRAIQSLNQAVSRIGSLYQARKITDATARTALATVGIPGAAVGEILADWDAITGINVKTLTESQIADAWDYQVMDEATALAELQNIGYTPYDAWVVLSVKNKSPLPNPPARGPSVTLGPVVPGTT